MDRPPKYNYEVYHRPCKANIMRIADGISCFPTKYSQSATAIDLEEMVLAVSHFHPWLPIFFIQLADAIIPEPSHQVYQKSNWYGKIISFLLDGPTAIDNLSPTEKKAVKRVSTKYRVTDQHLLYIEEAERVPNAPSLMRSLPSLSGRMMSTGIFQTSLHLIKYGANGIGQLELMMWSGFVELVRPTNLTDLEISVPTSVLSSVLSLGLW